MKQQLRLSSQAFKVTYYGPTNTKGSRVRIKDLRFKGQKPLWIPWDYEFNSTIDHAYAELERLGYKDLKHGDLDDKSYIILSDSWKDTQSFKALDEARAEQ